MTTAPIRDRVQTLKTSSSFTGGDPFSFVVQLEKDVKLPGRHDPAAYLERIGAQLKGKSVCIVCPGNAGLCIEALRAGAAGVLAFEPRPVYQKALQAVAAFSEEVFDEGFATTKSLDKAGPFDVVIWSEGVDDIQDPKTTIDAVIKSVAPAGVLYLELSHGTAGAVPDRTNSWKPTKDGLIATIKGYSDVRLDGEIDGRNQVRKIYTIKNTKAPEPFFVPQAPINPDAPSDVSVLSDQNSPDEDVEYFRKQLWNSLNLLREPTPAPAPEPVAATEPTPTEAPVEPKPDLSEVVDRQPEAETGKASTPKSRRKPGKESKS
jgi:hypothetical protein